MPGLIASRQMLGLVNIEPQPRHNEVRHNWPAERGPTTHTVTNLGPRNQAVFSFEKFASGVPGERFCFPVGCLPRRDLRMLDRRLDIVSGLEAHAPRRAPLRSTTPSGFAGRTKPFLTTDHRVRSTPKPRTADPRSQSPSPGDTDTDRRPDTEAALDPEGRRLRHRPRPGSRPHKQPADPALSATPAPRLPLSKTPGSATHGNSARRRRIEVDGGRPNPRVFPPKVVL